MQKRLKWLLLPVVWLVIIGVLLEAGLRLAAPALAGQLRIVAQEVMTGQPFEAIVQPAWQHDIDHFFALRPGLNNVLQFGSPGVSFHVTTISLWGSRIGFRTRPIDYYVDVVVVGDSFGFCFTELQDCWVTLLEQDTGLGIVNLSQWGTGMTSHERILATFGKPLEPPLVLWQFFGNDFNDDYGLAVLRGEIEELPEESINPLARPVVSPFDSPLVAWVRSHFVVYAVLETLLTGQWWGISGNHGVYLDRFRVSYRDGMLAFGKPYEQTALDMRLARNQAGLERSRQALIEATAGVNEWGGQLAVIIIPTREEVYAHLTASILGEEGMAVLVSAREAMLSLCDELRLLCLDTLSGLRLHALAGEHLYYTDDLHLNPHGNAVLAELVEDWLAENDLPPGHE